MNYFDLFDIPVTIQIDKAELTKKYIELQKKYHPDFFVHANEYDQEEALERSSELNKALKILKNEDLTIKYILQQKQVLEEDEKYQLPADFLMGMMELNEELSAGSDQQVRALQEELHKHVQYIIENYDDTAVAAADLAKLKEYYYKKKYLQRILDRLEG